ncbi:MAG TPA: hypothetical protein VHW23_39335 [Kofleriaceae bacterium]|jgi:hypothetical protein|nr:hypothetical protein [Kofleriaceae bacterium]
MFCTTLRVSLAVAALGATLGGCAVTDGDSEASQSAEVTVKPAASFTLTVSGGQAEEVISSTSNSVCNSTCGYVFAGGTPLTIEALEDNTGCLIFKHWDGACAGQGEVCSIVINSDLTTNAVYHFNAGGCH